MSSQDEKELCCPGFFDHGSKGFGISHGHVRQHLSIKSDAGHLHGMHQIAVADAIQTSGSVDAGDP